MDVANLAELATSLCHRDEVQRLVAGGVVASCYILVVS